MTTSFPTIYSDDPDPSWTFTVTSRDSTVVDWVSPLVAIGTAGYVVSGTFLGSASTVRQIRVPLSGLSVGNYTLYLRVPNGTDIKLGRITVAART